MFDAGGVLHIAGSSQSEDLKHELGLTDKQLTEFYSHYLPLLGTGLMTEAAMWEELHQKFGIRKVDIKERLLTRKFEASLEKMPGMYELVNELKQKNIKVVLLTNVSQQFAEILERKGHYEPFDLKVLSFETGLWKPDKKIYEYALAKAGAKAAETVFIDDLKENVAAANSVGMYGVLFESPTQVKALLQKLL